MSTTHIPSANEIEQTTGFPTWRFANGKICKGSEKEGTIEVLSLLAGVVKRFARQQGQYKDGKVYDKIEADLETSDGVQRISMTLLDNKGGFKASVAALHFARALVRITHDPEAVYQFSASQQDKKTVKDGNAASTYVNLAKVEYDEKAGKWKTTPIRFERDESGQSVNEATLTFIEALKSSPLYQERVYTKDDEDGEHEASAKDKLSAKLVELGYKSLDQESAQYLEFFKAGLKADFKTFADIPAASFEQILDPAVFGDFVANLDKQPWAKAVKGWGA